MSEPRTSTQRRYAAGLLGASMEAIEVSRSALEWQRQRPSRPSGAKLGVLLCALLAFTGVLAVIGRPPLLMPEAAAGVPRLRTLSPSLPVGKGMWIWQPENTENGNVDAIVAKAVATGLTHLYVRTGSSWDGFYAAPFLDQILPAAHRAGIKVLAWDFPRLISVADDVARANQAIQYRAAGDEHVDGFAADIETESEGTQITAEAAAAYGASLRQAAGAGVPLIAVVPRPSPERALYPYPQVVASFDAVAPMVYWLNREPYSDATGAIDDLKPLGKPVFPIGQAYDGGPEGGRRGVPPRAELIRFMQAALAGGSASVSFWSWQEADQQAWDSIRDAVEFRVPGAPAG